MKPIFISYAKEDVEEVKKLRERLHIIGFNTWMDIYNLIPSEDWVQAIEKAVKTSGIFLFCISRNSIKKKDGFFVKEMLLAFNSYKQLSDGSIVFLPAILDNLEEKDIPYLIANIQWVNLTEEYGFERLVRTLIEKEALSNSWYSMHLNYLGREKLREWGKEFANGHWDWDLLFHALENFRESIIHDRFNQQAFTNAAYVYYLIHAKDSNDLSKICLERAYALAGPGPNFPGNHFNKVKEAIDNKKFLNGEPYISQKLPLNLLEKYDAYITKDTDFTGLIYLIQDSYFIRKI